ncbi:hypothetical protein M405DRAFT_809780 [Rhizopogon salebrosus TDB-379]|nr:hypothetical protein M405DRAFT_809780 [Rhizopogon salebrosus TDB-379]
MQPGILSMFNASLSFMLTEVFTKTAALDSIKNFPQKRVHSGNQHNCGGLTSIQKLFLKEQWILFTPYSPGYNLSSVGFGGCSGHRATSSFGTVTQTSSHRGRGSDKTYSTQHHLLAQKTPMAVVQHTLSSASWSTNLVMLRRRRHLGPRLLCCRLPYAFGYSDRSI